MGPAPGGASILTLSRQCRDWRLTYGVRPDLARENRKRCPCTPRSDIPHNPSPNLIQQRAVFALPEGFGVLPHRKHRAARQRIIEHEPVHSAPVPGYQPHRFAKYFKLCDLQVAGSTARQRGGHRNLGAGAGKIDQHAIMRAISADEACRDRKPQTRRSTSADGGKSFGGRRMRRLGHCAKHRQWVFRPP